MAQGHHENALVHMQAEERHIRGRTRKRGTRESKSAQSRVLARVVGGEWPVETVDKKSDTQSLRVGSLQTSKARVLYNPGIQEVIDRSDRTPKGLALARYYLSRVCARQGQSLHSTNSCLLHKDDLTAHSSSARGGTGYAKQHD